MHLLIVLSALAINAAEPAQKPASQNPFLPALWFIQHQGTPAASTPAHDRATKSQLAKAVSKDGILTLPELEGLMDPSTFKTIAGDDAQISLEEIQSQLNQAIPPARAQLAPRIIQHLDLLSTQFDLIDPAKHASAQTIAQWIARNYQHGKPLHIIIVCTGNSRRSILGATMGNIAARYYGLPDVHFHSGGTDPTAFNPRTITTLQDIGLVIQPTGADAPRGEPKTANPVYRIRWGANPADTSTQVLEFSKTYSDPANPSSGFAALMVCDEADAACPTVPGADLRVSIPFLDPKSYDNSPFEAAKYAERRDDIGRVMLAAILQASRLIRKPS